MSASTPPNILVLFCDQLRRQALSCYGDPNIQTPNIDALANRGVRFDSACSTYPICVPFRFTMMTGEYGHKYNVPGINYLLDPAEHRMLADPFNEGGYHTAYIGKWHLADTGNCQAKPMVPPELQGRWQKWLGFELRNSHFDTWYSEDADPTPHKIDGYHTDGLFDLTMNHLRDGRPNAQYYGYNHRGIRGRRYKYVVRNGAPWLCFDLQNDPLEERNLLHHDPENLTLFAQLHDQLRERLIETEDPYPLSPAWNHAGHLPG